jgi:diacylglycerol kinase family enzyme
MIVILNAGAGSQPNSPPALRSKIATAFDAAGVSAEIVYVHGSESLHRAVHKALDTTADTIVAAGGDGTVSAIAG